MGNDIIYFGEDPGEDGVRITVPVPGTLPAPDAD